MKTLLFVALATVLSMTCVHAQNRELDPQIIPQEIIVRVDAQGNREVYKVAAKADVTNDQAAALAIETFATNENKVSSVVSESELDQTTSTESWYYYYNPYFSYGFNFGCNYYGYNYYYRPYYSYNYGYYNYYYYRYY